MFSKMFAQTKLCLKFARSNAEIPNLGFLGFFTLEEVMAYGVIGNTAGFGPVVLGSSPSRPTRNFLFSISFRQMSGFFVLGSKL